MAELPEPFGWLHDANGNDPLTFAKTLTALQPLVSSTMPVYTSSQVMEAVRQARMEEREMKTAMGVAWAAQLEAHGMDKGMALKIVAETTERIAAAIRGPGRGRE